MKFHKKRLKFVIPIAVVVAISATFMLVNRYAEVPTTDKFMIVASATVFSALISYFLFPQPGDNPEDVGPYR